MFEAVEKFASRYADRMGLVVEDLKTGEKISQLPHKPFSSASLIKYPIMWAFFKKVSEGKESLDTIHILRAEDKAGTSPFDSSVLRELHVGVPLTLEDWVKSMIVISDDTATNILMHRLGMDYLNDTFREIGLLDTRVGRFMMDYEGAEAGRDNFVSAEDMNRLSKIICANEYLPATYNSQMLAILCNQRHNDSLRRYLPMSLQMGHKGGCIRQYHIDHDCGIIFENSLPRLLVNVCTKDIENSKEVLGEVGKLVYAALSPESTI